MKLFNIKLEFNKKVVIETINSFLKQHKCNYICVVDGNVLANANRGEEYNKIINSSLVNICDGNFIALLANIIYKKNFRRLTGSELFGVLLKERRYRSYFLGNTEEVLKGLKISLSKIDSSVETMKFKSLPFMDVDQFDYRLIAEEINNDNPDLIWISLGAPKQERFMYMLQPFLKRGIMIGVGAVFNFYSLKSEEKRAPSIFLKYKLEWLYRTIKNPTKQLPKAISFVKIIPKLYFNERKIINRID